MSLLGHLQHHKYYHVKCSCKNLNTSFYYVILLLNDFFKKEYEGAKDMSLLNVLSHMCTYSYQSLVEKRKMPKIKIKTSSWALCFHMCLYSQITHHSPCSPQSLAAQASPGIIGNLNTTKREVLLCRWEYRTKLDAWCDCSVWASKVTEKHQVLLGLAPAEQASNINYG